MPADELAIRALVAHFADIVNRRAYDELPEVWANEGVWQIPGYDDCIGPAAMADRLRGLLDNHEALVQLVHSGRIWLDDNRAAGRWYISEVARGVDGQSRMFAGVYHDETVRKADGWRFIRRRYESLIRVDL